MRVHVINLARSSERRAAIEARLQALGIDYEVSAAVDGREGERDFEDQDAELYWLNTGRSPSADEIGCYASHLRLWRRCAASGLPLVVMEDDAGPLPAFPAAVEAASRLIERYGFIRLDYDGPTHPARTRAIEVSGEFTVHYFARYPYGTMCYALSPAVAHVFVARSRILRSPVDQFIRRCWEHRQPLYGLLPYAVREGPLAFDSTIKARDNETHAAAMRARRFLYKLATSVQRAAFNQRCWYRGIAARGH